MENKTFFELVIRVLGRTKRAIEMITGSKIFKEKETLIISNIQASQKIKNIHIKVNGLDLFDIFFLDKSGKVLKIENDVYIDQIKNILENETKIFFSFN